MTRVADVDRLVVDADAAVAHYWPRLGPKVRSAYLDDRNNWIEIRRAPDAGAATPPATLETQRRVFAGWVRAFKAVGARPRHRKATQAAPAAAQASPATAAPVAQAAAAAAPALATAGKGAGGAGAAVAGGLVLAGLIAVAARRRRA